MEWFKNNTELIIAIMAIIAVVISFISIILTLVSIMLEKRHFQKSVKPIANVSPIDYEDDISVKIFNRGSGPMIIKEFKAEYDGVIESNLINFMPKLPPNVYWTTFFDKLEEFSLLPGDSINLIEFKPDLNNKIEIGYRDDVRKKLSQITMSVRYSDIYDNDMPIKIKKLTWFVRHFK